MTEYPPIPNAELFLHNYGYERPVSIERWEWSSTFSKWSALVTFEDGWRGFSFPKPEWMPVNTECTGDCCDQNTLPECPCDCHLQ